MNIDPPRFDPDRSRAIQELLIDTVESQHSPEATSLRRPLVRIGIISVAAFALVGALTGGAVASTATTGAQQAAGEATARSAAMQMIAEQDGVALGQPVSRTGTKATIVLAKRPRGANWTVVGVTCLQAGSITTQDSSGSTSGDNCTKSQVNTAGAEGGPANGKLPLVVIVTTDESARFSVWVTWAHVPTFAPSEFEKRELAGKIITRADDLAAFERYSVCMSALGYSLSHTSEAKLTPAYTEPKRSDANGSNQRCYQMQYQAVDRMWQSEVQFGHVAVASITNCLAIRHVTPASTPDARMAQFVVLKKNWQDICNYSG
jgi:hypothetical protein